MDNQSQKTNPQPNIPERQRGGNIFPEKASEKISQFPKMNKFGEPEDLIPKERSEELKQPEKPEMKPQQQTKAEPAQDMQPNDQYEGPSIQDLERKGLIKKVIIGVVVVIILAVIGVVVYSQFFASPEEEVEVVEVEEEEKVEGDSDNDGLPDTWEEEHGLNYNDPRDPDYDPDFDSLINSDEYEYGTDPNNPDSDNDGYKDGDEVNRGYNPKGSGSLNSENNNGESASYSTMRGEWSGTLSGNLYNSTLLNSTLQSNGYMSGKLFMTLTGLQEGDIQSDISGTYTYQKESNVFKAEITGKAAYMKGNNVLTRGEFSLTLDGTVSNNDRNISGTWLIVPDSEQFWLKQDRGNFTLNKTSEF